MVVMLRLCLTVAGPRIPQAARLKRMELEASFNAQAAQAPGGWACDVQQRGRSLGC